MLGSLLGRRRQRKADQAANRDRADAAGAKRPLQAGYRRATGQRYTEFFEQLHAALHVDWYLEVGCRAGTSFAPVRSKTIAIDPYFKAETNIIGSKPRLFVFQETSDSFFKSGFLKLNKIDLSFSFLDGMHLFEFLLRDFMNAEANSLAKGVIAMHDCCPFTERMQTRDLEKLPPGAWTGDVWKIVPILQEYRPDLNVTVLGCRPTGLVMVSNLDPANTVLQENYDEIIRRFTPHTLESWGAKKFYDSFAYADPQEFAEAGYPLLSGVRLEESLALAPKPVTK
jgi:hypothetical protein